MLPCIAPQTPLASTGRAGGVEWGRIEGGISIHPNNPDRNERRGQSGGMGEDGKDRLGKSANRGNGECAPNSSSPRLPSPYNRW